MASFKTAIIIMIAGLALIETFPNPVIAQDCNNNGVADVCELVGNDLNGNGIPDDCEDCNRNGILDECDLNCGAPGSYCDTLGCGQSTDCNANGIPDECDVGPQDFALAFDGSNDYVRVPRDPSLESTEITIEMWAFLNGQQTRNTRMLRKYNGTGYIFAADQDNDKKIQLRVSGVAVKDTQQHTAYVGQWHHFAGVYTATEMRLYVDGDLVNTTAHSNGPLSHSVIDLYFASGKPASDPSEYFNGRLDEIRIWSVPRTGDQIRAAMNTLLSGSEAGLVGYWRLDDGDGQYATDRSSSGNDGILGTSESPIGDSSDPVWLAREAGEYLPDCNGNGFPDECDLDPIDPDGNGEVSDDCNGSGVPDECEIAGASLSELEQAELSPFSGYYYMLTPSSASWATNEAYAAGFGGHLATVRSAEENQWLVDTFSPMTSESEAHIGLTDEATEGVWVWASGEALGYTNWGNGQPDNSGNEDFVDLIFSNGTWNDNYRDSIGIIEIFLTNDCNENGKLDECDIASMTSEDCNLNGIPDECEAVADCDDNGIQDICEIFNGTSPDCDNDGVPNVCELSGNDCNFNSIPDNCEPGGTDDCNANGIPDLCDVLNGTSLDCNNNAIPDDCDISGGSSTDVNSNGIPDDCELDARVISVITLIDPATTTEVRTDFPDTLTGVVEGSRYFIEVWASDVGGVNTGLSGVYVDVSFCTTNVATSVFHGSTFDFLPLGTVQSGGVDEFGGATFQSNAAVEPEWVRVGWIEMNPGTGVSPCTVSLLPSQNGIGAVGRGILNWAFVELGSIDLAITPTTVTYDLDADGFIGFGDFALFSSSWLQTVPPADSTHDFDCDGFVGPGDLSWFATGWQKSVGDPTILYPVCSPAAAARGAGPGPVDVEARVIILSALSASNTATSLPTSISEIALGDTYVVEIWVSDIGDIDSGFTSAYLDMTFPDIATTTQGVFSSTGLWSVFQSGADNGLGVIENLGGSVLPGGVGMEPEWVRVGYVQLLADTSAPTATFTLSQSSAGLAALARGLITWSDISLDSRTLAQGILGDIDSDGDKDGEDIDLFISVLLGTEQQAVFRIASDFTGDGIPSGLDVQPFVDAFMGVP